MATIEERLLALEQAEAERKRKEEEKAKKKKKATEGATDRASREEPLDFPETLEELGDQITIAATKAMLELKKSLKNLDKLLKK